jgi:hypothetical protein
MMSPAKIMKNITAAVIGPRTPNVMLVTKLGAGTRTAMEAA